MSDAPFDFSPAPGVRIVEDGRGSIARDVGGNPIPAFDTRPVRMNADRLLELAAVDLSSQYGEGVAKGARYRLEGLDGRWDPDDLARGVLDAIGGASASRTLGSSGSTAAKTASTTSASSARMMTGTPPGRRTWAAPGMKTGPSRRPVDGPVNAYPRGS